MSTLNRFVTVTSQAKMPGKCWGRYQRIAVIEVDTDHLAEIGRTAPLGIGGHFRGTLRIIRSWERRYLGTTDRCAAARAEAAAEKLCEACNEAWYAAYPDQLESDLARSAS